MRHRRLSIQQIETFRAVMQTGSISAAARQLGVSQPSLTRLLKRSADIVGLPLFDLVKNRVVPTAEARELIRYIEYLDERFEGLDGAIARLRGQGTGLFRFGGSPSLGRALIPEGLARFRRGFPDVRLHFDTIQLQSVVDYLVLGRGECFLSIVPVVHAALEIRTMCPARLVCVMPSDHSLAGEAVLRAADLAGEALILTDPSRWYGQRVIELIGEAGLDARPNTIVRVAESAIGLVRCGLGVAIIDEFSAMHVDAGLAVRLLDIRPFSSLMLHRNGDAPRSRYVEAFKDELIAAATANQIL